VRWRIRARRAVGAERERLWSRWAEIDKNLDAYAALRPTATEVVVLKSLEAPLQREQKPRRAEWIEHDRRFPARHRHRPFSA
jgi:hypothetical protein